MNFLQDYITYVRRIIKSPSNAQITDSLIIDYINRFYINDVAARVQLFDMKTRYIFETTPGIIDYNMPLYQIQNNGTISYYPVYQGFIGEALVNGIPVSFQTQRESFYNSFPLYAQPLNQVATGVGGDVVDYQFQLPYFPAIPGHVDMTGMLLAGYTSDPIFTADLISSIPMTSVQSRVFLTYTSANGQNVIVQDSGQFLASATDGCLYGLLISPGTPPGSGTRLDGGYSMTSNTVNYNTGVVNVTFNDAPPAGVPIQAQCYFYAEGLPRSMLYYNNTLTILPPAFTQYIVDIGAYLTPAAFFASSAAIPFGYMTEYIARGAARKILSDTGDVEQFMFYEPLFLEQENLVHIRSQRQWTATRTQTIFSQNEGIGNTNSTAQGSL